MAGSLADHTGVGVERDVGAEMRDGTVLRADIYRPGKGGRWPVLLLRTPYNKTIAQTSAYAHPAWYAAHGYVVVVQDVRGRFRSDGKFVPFEHEAADGYDTVRWAAGLGGTTGEVGLYGFSYPGAAGYLAAAEGPPELRCAALACTAPDLNDGWLLRGGVLQLAFMLHWLVDLLAVPDAAARGLTSRVRELATLAVDLQRRSLYSPTTQLAAEHPELLETLQRWLSDERARALDPERLEQIRVPVLSIGGWFDCFSAGTLNAHQRLSEHSTDCRLIMGPWLHAPWTPLVGEEDFGPAAVSRIDRCQLAWFDSWLKGEGPHAGGLAGASLFIGGLREWRDLPHWPPAHSFERIWFLHSDGRAATDLADGRLDRDEPGDEPADIFVFDPANPVPTHGGTCLCAEQTAPVGVLDQRPVASRTDVAVYTSGVLSDAVEMIGTPRLVLVSATDAAEADWMAKLVDVDPYGRSLNVCDGVRRVVPADRSDGGSAGVSGTTCCELCFAPAAHVFKAGHRIRLQLANSDFPQFEINTGDGSDPGDRVPVVSGPRTQAVFHQTGLSSRLIVPTSSVQPMSGV